MNEPTISYYLDTNALLKSSALLMQYKKDEKGVEKVKALIESSLTPVFVSDLSILEGVAKITKFARRDLFGKENRAKGVMEAIISNWITHIKQGDLKSIPVSSDQYAVATGILKKYPFADFGAFDALHVAIIGGLGTNVYMVSSDKGVKNICGLENIPVYDPESM